jgi:hypothetical protein
MLRQEMGRGEVPSRGLRHIEPEHDEKDRERE